MSVTVGGVAAVLLTGNLTLYWVCLSGLVGFRDDREYVLVFASVYFLCVFVDFLALAICGMTIILN